MTFSVAVVGASGYAGGEVLRLLTAHPEARIGALTANQSAGQRLGQHHPHLRTLTNRRLEETTVAVLTGHDVIILALPHGKSGELAAALEEASPQSVLVGLGADHRLESAQDWADYYGGDYQGAWTYGLPELLTGWTESPVGPSVDDAVRSATSGRSPQATAGSSADGVAALAGTELGAKAAPEAGPTASGKLPKQRQALKGAKRIAVPGCNVTAVTLALAPGVAAGQLDPRDLVAVLANGVSGAGKSLKPHLLASEILGAASPYAVGGSHRHIPEIIQNLRRALGVNGGGGPTLQGAPAVGAPPPVALPTISFTPTLVPMSRGILATVTARPGPRFDPATLRAAWQRAYGQERFVHLLDEGDWPSTARTLGANTALIQVAYDARAGRIVIVAAIDNLVKGTAGAAIQSINLALGLPEGTGLELNGVAP
ncbi:MAG: N-acetyl-gamma-glutamyl-phosphate reductase [Bifidobacteriaceae bacterium]|nr:N-acetyl-gamma-glutamyl-phosphate reductase [Bifidobacteriaceae bacterium]